MSKWYRQTGPGGVGSPAQTERMVPSSPGSQSQAGNANLMFVYKHK